MTRHKLTVSGRWGQDRQSGFSLLEVNLAILIIALGMLVLFGLFPSGLRMGENAVADTHTAMFADTVLSGLRQKAMGVTNWSDWRNYNRLTDALALKLGLPLMDPDWIIRSAPAMVQGNLDPSGPQLAFPANSGRFVHYVLDISPVAPGSRLVKANLWVWTGAGCPTNAGTFMARAPWYMTELYYPGTP